MAAGLNAPGTGLEKQMLLPCPLFSPVPQQSACTTLDPIQEIETLDDYARACGADDFEEGDLFEAVHWTVENGQIVAGIPSQAGVDCDEQFEEDEASKLCEAHQAGLESSPASPSKKTASPSRGKRLLTPPGSLQSDQSATTEPSVTDHDAAEFPVSPSTVINTAEEAETSTRDHLDWLYAWTVSGRAEREAKCQSNTAISTNLTEDDILATGPHPTAQVLEQEHCGPRS